VFICGRFVLESMKLYRFLFTIRIWPFRLSRITMF